MAATAQHHALKGPMLALRFALELVVLAAYTVWGWDLVTGPLRILTAVLALAVVTSVWGILVAPKSAQRLRDPARLVTELIVFAGAGAALWGVGRPVWGAVLALVAIANGVVVRRWEPDDGLPVNRG